MPPHEGPPPPPPGCSTRLLHNVIEQRARDGHPRPIASVPRSGTLEEGYTDVSYSMFANAIDRLAHWILTTLGTPTRDCEPIVYVAPLDLRYQILMIAAVKNGYITCLMSPRNSRDAFASLLQECGATKLLTTDPPSPAIATMLKCQVMTTFTIPPLNELLDETPVPPVRINATWEAWRFRPFVMIHSSGSTGTPKLFTLKHGSFAALDGFQLLEGNELGQRFGNMRGFVSLPPFHIAGITYTLALPVWLDFTAVLPPVSPLNAAVVNNAHLSGRVEFTLLPPSIVVDLTKDTTYLQNLIDLERVVFTGGPLPEAAGKLIAPHARLDAGYGATEWNAVPQLPKDREDWAFMRFNEKQGGLEFRKQDNGLYEMVICRSEEWGMAQPVFVTLPEVHEFHSKDLFSPHPTKPGLWKYTSRSDDIIVFSNGEKLNPVTFEGIVSSSPDVKGCVVIGQGRFQASLLIEPLSPPGDEQELLDQVWPYIQKANKITVRHGRVARDCVFFTTPEKPLPRAGKGTIQRAATNALYVPETDALYTRIHAAPLVDHVPFKMAPILIDGESPERTMASLRKFISGEIGLEGAKDTDDFFMLGMDSLQVVNIVRAINTARPDNPIDAKQVYDHPSIVQLAQYLHTPPSRLVDNDDSDDEELKESWLAMEEMYQELSARMTPNPGRRRRRPNLNGWLHPSNQGPVLPPDGGKIAWLQVLAMALVNFNNFGLVNSFGVFQAYYEATLLRTSSPSSIAIIGTLQGALLLIVGVVSGPLFDKGYFKPALVVASLGLVFALMMLSLSTKYYQVFLSQGLLLGICSGLLYIPSIALIPVYFKQRRGLALGLATGGGSIGGVIYPIIFRRLVVEVGFGWAVRVLGFIALVTLGIAVGLSKPIGVRIQRKLLEPSAFRDKAYVTFLVSAFFLLAAMFVPFFLATAYSIQHLHANTGLSFYLISIMNAAQFFGRLLPAWLADHRHRILGPETFQFAGEVLMGILGFAWIGVGSFGDFIPWVIFYGFFSGMTVTLPAVVLPHICPNLAVYGTRIGMLYACAGVGLLISTPIASALNASSGGFLGAQLWTGACCLVASLLFVVTGLEIRERRLRYEMGKRGKRGPRGREMHMAFFHWDMMFRIKEKS